MEERRLTKEDVKQSLMVRTPSRVAKLHGLSGVRTTKHQSRGDSTKAGRCSTSSKVRAVCGSSARTDLCAGWLVRDIPTAIPWGVCLNRKMTECLVWVDPLSSSHYRVQRPIKPMCRPNTKAHLRHRLHSQTTTLGQRRRQVQRIVDRRRFSPSSRCRWLRRPGASSVCRVGATASPPTRHRTGRLYGPTALRLPPHGH